MTQSDKGHSSEVPSEQGNQIDDEPKCDKCGVEITTGLMAVFCPKGKDCEFWVPEVEEFLKDWHEPQDECQMNEPKPQPRDIMSEPWIPIHGYLDGKALVDVNALEQAERALAQAQSELRREKHAYDAAVNSHREYVRSIQAAIVDTIGGTVEGQPTHEGNYLQRLREVMTELTQAQARCAEVEKLAAFGNWVLEELRGDNIGSDLDGGSAQNKAEEIGLLVYVDVAEPCGERCQCAEYDDFPQKCLRRSDAALKG